jgi:hypothetical protein
MRPKQVTYWSTFVTRRGGRKRKTGTWQHLPFFKFTVQKCIFDTNLSIQASNFDEL